MPRSCFAQSLSNQRRSKTIKWEIFYINEAAQLLEKIVKNLVHKIANQSLAGTLIDYAWFSDCSILITQLTLKNQQSISKNYMLFTVYLLTTQFHKKTMNQILGSILQLLGLCMRLKLTVHMNKLLNSSGLFGQFLIRYESNFLPHFHIR